METIKNYIIAFLLAVIALMLFTQPAQSAGKSVQAKTVEYQVCLEQQAPNFLLLDQPIAICGKYRP
jgi:hypothetical protein